MGFLFNRASKFGSIPEPSFMSILATIAIALAGTLPARMPAEPLAVGGNYFD